MKLEGVAKNHQGMSQFDNIMNQTFGMKSVQRIEKEDFLFMMKKHTFLLY